MRVQKYLIVITAPFPPPENFLFRWPRAQNFGCERAGGNPNRTFVSNKNSARSRGGEAPKGFTSKALSGHSLDMPTNRKNKLPKHRLFRLHEWITKKGATQGTKQRGFFCKQDPALRGKKMILSQNSSSRSCSFSIEKRIMKRSNTIRRNFDVLYGRALFTQKSTPVPQ